MQKCYGKPPPKTVSSLDAFISRYRASKFGDGDFYPHLRSEAYSEFEENAGISLQIASKLSVNGPMKPQKYSQIDEDLYFRFEKFPSATLQKFLPPERNMQFAVIIAEFAFRLRYT